MRIKKIRLCRYVMERQLRAARKLRKSYAWPYDLGCWRNWTTFFGGGVRKWFFPSAPKEDGIHFERRKE
jgi:hypothetical protein